MEPSLVKRTELPTVREVVVHGKTHYLGVLKEFIKDDRIREFLPKDLPVSMAWVRLDKDEVLAIHTHPVDSMILICEGKGRSIGELNCPMEEGDAVMVPSGHAHGFVGEGPNGFWGLSLQFESRGLYEDLRDPWASFQDHEIHNLDVPDCPDMPALFTRNVELSERFGKSRLFTAAERGGLTDPAAQGRLLDCLELWVGYLEQLPPSSRLGADERAALPALKRMVRGGGPRRRIRDASLESLASWFIWKAETAPAAERLVLTPMVLEPALAIVYRGLRQYVAGAARYPDLPSPDWRHVAPSFEALGTTGWSALANLQRDAWDTASALLGRTATLVLR